MGEIDCKVHGGQGFFEMCVHLFESLQNLAPVEFRELPVFGTRLCMACYQANAVDQIPDLSMEELLELPEETQDPIYNRISSVYNRIERRYECVECYHERLLKAARKHGDPLPFEPFENTLIHSNRVVIKRLEYRLKRAFQFPKSKVAVSGAWDAFTLNEGTVRSPFTIKFYYVTDKVEQDLLLRVITGFFEDIPQKQCIVQFYESENWIVQSTQSGLLGGYRGELKLLREVVFK